MNFEDGEFSKSVSLWSLSTHPQKMPLCHKMGSQKALERKATSCLYVNGMVACNNLLILTHDRETQAYKVMMLNLEKARDLGVGSG